MPRLTWQPADRWLVAEDDCRFDAETIQERRQAERQLSAGSRVFRRP